MSDRKKAKGDALEGRLPLPRDFMRQIGLEGNQVVIDWLRENGAPEDIRYLMEGCDYILYVLSLRLDEHELLDERSLNSAFREVAEAGVKYGSDFFGGFKNRKKEDQAEAPEEAEADEEAEGEEEAEAAEEE